MNIFKGTTLVVFHRGGAAMVVKVVELSEDGEVIKVECPGHFCMSFLRGREGGILGGPEGDEWELAVPMAIL